MIISVLLMLLLNLLPLALLVWGINKLARSRMSKKSALRLMVFYCLLLALSPSVAAIVLDGSEWVEPVTVPHFYYQAVLEKDENLTLEDLLQDKYLHLLEVTEIPMAAHDFSEERPLHIPTRYRDHDDGYQPYRYQLVVEVTEEVDKVKIFQLTQRMFIDDVETSNEIIPWTWAVTGDRLQPTVHPTEIVHYQVFPHPHYFHFTEKKPASLGVFPHESLVKSLHTGGVIQWIRVPTALSYTITGPEHHRFIERH